LIVGFKESKEYLVMNKKTIGALGLILFLLAGPLSVRPQTPPAQEKTLALTLEDCILKALKNNYDLAVQVMNPELSDIAVALAQEKFIPSLSFGFNRRDTSQASYSWLDATDTTKQLRDNYTAQLSQQIPFGGSLTLNLNEIKTDTNARFQTINPRFETTLNFSFSQPLLRNFGLRMSQREIIVAQNNFDISEKQFAKFVQDLVYQVEQAYWNLVYGIENLKVRQQSLKLAQELLEKNRRSVEVGTLAPIEVLNAQADVASREADILDAQALVKNYEDALKAVTNLAAEMPEASDMRLMPADRPTFEKVEAGLNQAMATAIANRPDLAASKIDIQNREFNLGYARNQLLPDLSLTAQYWSPGVSGSQLLYENNDPLFGAVIGTIPGNVSQALKDTFKFRYQNWSVGLTLSIPLNTIFSRAYAAQARVSLDQALANFKAQEQQLVLEVRSAVRGVETNYMRAEAYRVARELAQKRLEAEEEKFRVGLSTNYFVLQYQRDLANQQSMELKSLIDYNLSLAKLAQVTGVSLGNKNISLSEIRTR
jgi:outer membrane protein TolC